MRLTYFCAATGQLRTARSGQLVVPVVALVGDLTIHPINAPTPEFVPLEILSEAPDRWDGMPVCLGHPVDARGRQISASTPAVLERYGLGTIAHARIDNGRLCADLVIDEAKAARLGANRLLDRLRAGEHVECSVGCFVQTANEGGRVVWKTIIPNHVALLESSRGACSVSAGCGTHQRAAEVAHLQEITTMADIYSNPPDPYAAGLAKLRQQDHPSPVMSKADQLADMDAFRRDVIDVATTSQASALAPATSDVYLKPPDGYALAIERMRKENR